MKLIAAVWLGVAVAALAVGGCTSKPTTAAPTFQYVNERGQFSMTLPQGWIANEGEGKVAAILRSPPDAHGSSIATIAVMMEDAPAGNPFTLDGVAATARKSVQGLPGCQNISEETLTLADGTKAWIVMFQFRPNPTGPVIQQRQMHVVTANRSYTLGATATPENFPAARTSFDICLNSFRVGTAAATPTATGTAP